MFLCILVWRVPGELKEGSVESTTIHPVKRPRSRRIRDTLLLVAAGVVLVLALVGLIAVGEITAHAIAGPGAAPHRRQAAVTRRRGGTPSTLKRASLQATAIVAAARRRSGAIVHAAQKQAGRERKAARVVAARPVPTAIPAPVPAPTASTSGPITSAAPVVTQTPRTSAPNLSNLPSSWKVVAYNATFGGAAGSVGTVTVTNRGQLPYRGMATITYLGQNGALGTASASFSRLLPGQTEVLPLSGAARPTGTTPYQIEVTGVRAVS